LEAVGVGEGLHRPALRTAEKPQRRSGRRWHACRSKEQAEQSRGDEGADGNDDNPQEPGAAGPGDSCACGRTEASVSWAKRSLKPARKLSTTSARCACSVLLPAIG